MPSPPQAPAALAVELQRYLQDARESLIATLEGLDEYAVRRPMTPTATSLLGLVKHLIGIEASYLGSCVARPAPFTLPWVEDGSIWDGADMWATAAETRAELLGLYRAAWAHADRSIAQVPLDAPAYVEWWPEERRATTFGHLLVRVVAETAQHAGHADIVREQLAGRGADTDEAGDDATWSAYHHQVQEAANAHRGDARA